MMLYPAQTQVYLELNALSVYQKQASLHLKIKQHLK
jgi:hypothetical protein